MSKPWQWVKQRTDFFESDDMQIVREQPQNGYQYLYLWQKLLLRAVDQDELGVLRYKPDIPYSPLILSTITGLNIDIVKNGLELFKKLGMMEVRPDGAIWIRCAQDLVGSEKSAARMRTLRQRRKETLFLEAQSEPDQDSSPASEPRTKSQEYSADFEAAWDLYPRKVEKLRAWKVWRAALKAGATAAELTEAARAYALKCSGKSEEFIKHPATFWGPSQPWREFLNGQAQEVKKAKVPDNLCPKCRVGTVVAGMCRAPGCGYRVPVGVNK